MHSHVQQLVHVLGPYQGCNKTLPYSQRCGKDLATAAEWDDLRILLKDGAITKVRCFAFLYFSRDSSSVDRLTTAITKMRVTAWGDALNRQDIMKTCMMTARPNWKRTERWLHPSDFWIGVLQSIFGKGPSSSVGVRRSEPRLTWAVPPSLLFHEVVQLRCSVTRVFRSILFDRLLTLFAPHVVACRKWAVNFGFGF